MRDKELRLALVCYGGISLAVYMHGVTKEIWRLARASRAELDGDAPSSGVEAVYRALLASVSTAGGARLRVMTDIVAGASAGGINGIFLSRAVATGESLDPLTDLWLDKADVTVLLDPDARPWSRFSKFWAVPIAWLVSRAPRNAIDSTVQRSARGEVRAKLSQFVRARWFAPPFGGEIFSGLLLDAFDAMAAGPKGAPLLPEAQPLDLMVTVTDFAGHVETMRLNSPAEVAETEHRLIFAFHHGPGHADDLADTPGLVFAARATASFPGAFPPFTARELDRVLHRRGIDWAGRAAFLRRQLCPDEADCTAEDRALVDGSVLANAPFRPAIAALRQRPARREVDRRFVYIDPKPGRRSISIGGRGAGGEPPGFFASIFKTLSDIPREQPIRDNVEALQTISDRIARMRAIVGAMRPEVEERIEAALGRTFFLDRPTPARLANWRAQTQHRAAQEAGYAFVGYAQLKLTLIVDDIAAVAARAHDGADQRAEADWRARIGRWVQAQGLDRIDTDSRKNAAVITFFRSHDIGFRVRRLRYLARRLDEIASGSDALAGELSDRVRDAIFGTLGIYLDRETRQYYANLPIAAEDRQDPGPLVEAIAWRRDLIAADALADQRLAAAFALLPKAERREMIHAYLGFAFYDAATLPLLQGEGDGEFDPIKIDRISPDDATAIRPGGAEATLKGIQFNSFGAFFSRAFRENDYLWGRLHAAERLIAIVASTVPLGSALSADELRALQRDAFRAILDEEEARLTAVPGLIAEIRSEVG
jgi:patatin-related protein